MPGGTPDRNTVEFGIGMGEYESVGGFPSAPSKSWSQTPRHRNGCVEAYHIHRTRLELIAERKFRLRLLTDERNVEITDRDLREREAPPFARSFSVGLLCKGRATSSSRRQTPISGWALARPPA